MSSRTRYIAPKRVEKAFGEDAADGYLGVVASIVGDRLQVNSLRGEERDILLPDASAVAHALERPDITRLGGRPLVFVSMRYELVALAIGPAEAPERLGVLPNLVRLGEHGAVEVFGSDDTQPSWLLFDVERGVAETPRQ